LSHIALHSFLFTPFKRFSISKDNIALSPIPIGYALTSILSKREYDLSMRGNGGKSLIAQSYALFFWIKLNHALDLSKNKILGEV
jgi:hypothetical protein